MAKRKVPERGRSYIVAPGQRIDHSADGRFYGAGAEVRLDHLDPPDVAALVQAGVVIGEVPALPVEAVGVPADAALRLWKMGIREPVHLLAPSAAALGALAGVSADRARAWQDAAGGENPPPEEKE